MRARGIKPGFFENEHLGELSPHARLLFIGLWMLADREGRLEDRPKKIRADLFRYEDVNIEALLEELAQPDEYGEQQIIRYEAEGRAYIWIPRFSEHQKPHQNEKASVIPPYEEGIAPKEASENNQGAIETQELATKVQSTCDQGDNSLLPRNNPLGPDLLIPDSGFLIPEEEKKSSLRSDFSSPPPKADADQNEQTLEEESGSAVLTDESGVKDPPVCPFTELVDLYHELLPELPRLKKHTSARQSSARGRWRETWAGLRKEGKPHDKQALLAYFRRFFSYVSQSDFLMGRVTDWSADFEWLFTAKGFARVVEGNYHGKKDAA